MVELTSSNRPSCRNKAAASEERHRLRAATRADPCNSAATLRSWPLPCRAPKPLSGGQYRRRCKPIPAKDRDLHHTATESVEVREVREVGLPELPSRVQWLPNSPALE